MMQQDPVFGPIPPDEFRSFAALPFGEARKAIRKHDPLWGLETGEPIKWEVKFTRTIKEEGYATVTATTADEAQKLADKLSEHQISWDCGYGDSEDVTVESIGPAKS